MTILTKQQQQQQQQQHQDMSKRQREEKTSTSSATATATATTTRTSSRRRRSNYKGTILATRNGKYKVAYHRIPLGIFETEKLAAIAWDQAALEHGRPKTELNFPNLIQKKKKH